MDDLQFIVFVNVDLLWIVQYNALIIRAEMFKFSTFQGESIDSS